MYKYLLLLIFLSAGFITRAQHTQLVKGSVVDKESKMPLIGVTISIIDLSPTLGDVTNEDGMFFIDAVPIGKHTIQVSYVGYQSITIANVLVTSGKQIVLPIELEESVTNMDEVVIASRRDHVNEMALISTKTFDVQETERYAGSRQDPARMAANFAGVVGANDSRNDIVIRGNSPSGVLWRLEDVDIPNPNHFAVAGTSGGPQSMLNNKTLANSDFFTGAFPSGYGNSTAGVFDLKLRNGNKDKYELTGQLGFLGTELAAEGPLSKKSGASFLVTYRYSTLKLFEGLNINLGTNSVPNYQDAAFKLNFPINKKLNLAFFGIGGLSKIDLIVSNQTEPPEELYGETDRDQYFYSNTGVVGSTLSYSINNTAYAKITVAQTATDIGSKHEKVFRGANYQVDSLKDILYYKFITNTTVAHAFLNKKLSKKQTIRVGVINNYYHSNLYDSSRQYPTSRQDWQHKMSYKGGTDLIQAYAQYKVRPTEFWTIIIGLHGQYLTHNGSKSLEPRLAIRKRMHNGDAFSFGYGLHSQMQPLYQYYANQPQNRLVQHNYNVGFTRSHHSVLGYEHAFSRTFKMRSEIYYQYLFNVPIETTPGSSFSGLNQGASFSRLFPNKLVNKGTGYNYGVELTLEKGFSNGYYFLFSGSLFDSRAKGNDGVYRKTDYNSTFALNLLGGYERKLGKNSTVLTGIKVTYTGGRLYSPADPVASSALGDLVVIDSLRNTEQFPNYFRLDLKLGFRFNGKRLTHELAFDLVNVLGTRNLLSQVYNDDLAIQGQYPFVRQYQLGFLPLFYYKVDLGLGKK